MPVIFMQRRAVVVAYCPIFDLIEVGDDMAEARENFVVELEAFLERVAEHGLIEDLLVSTGWNIDGETYVAPRIIGFEDVPIEFETEGTPDTPCQ